MKLSTHADYAVRAVYELACHEPGAVLQTHAIAAAQGIPESYLIKVLQQLGRARVVRTMRGNHGGVTLARPADDISVRDVYEAVEGPVRLRRCVEHARGREQAQDVPVGRACEDEHCGTHDLWTTIEAVLAQELQNVNFAALAAADRRTGDRQVAPATSGR